MSQQQQEIIQLEKNLPVLKQKYEDSLKEFLAIPQDATRLTARREALQTFHSAGVGFFNGYERLVALGSLTGADKDSTWYTDKAETAADLLETIENHYRTLFAKADELHLSRDTFRPSSRAYANLQRLVKETDGQYASEIRVRFAGLGIPTHGFDKDESRKPGTSGIEPRYFIVGVITLLFALCLVAWAFRLGNLTKDQRFLLLWALPIAGAFASGCFTGSITAEGKRLGWALAVAATGGFAVWLITYLMLRNAIPEDAPPQPTSLATPDDVNITDVAFEAHEDDARAPRLDFKLSNAGTRLACVTRVTVRVKQSWRLDDLPRTVEAPVLPSHSYKLRLKPRRPPFQEALSIYHGLKADEFDRFTVQLEVDFAEAGNAIYLADVEILNGDKVVHQKKDVLFLITQDGPCFPDKRGFQKLIESQRSLRREVDPARVMKTLVANKATILKVASVRGTRSPALQRLIDTAQKSDLV